MNKVLPFLFLLSVIVYPQSRILSLRNDVRIIPVSENSVSLSTAPSGKKNAGLAIIYSLILPGLGDLYADNYSSGKYFTIAEGALWLSYLGLDTYGGWLKDRYRSFAVSNGAVDPAGKDADYYATISEYMNIDEYNNEQALNRSFDQMYSSDKYWQWQTSNDRKSYRNMWVSSEQVYNNMRFIIGGLIVNRLVSAIFAVKSVSAYNKRLTEQSWNISAAVLPDYINQGFKLQVFTTF